MKKIVVVDNATLFSEGLSMIVEKNISDSQVVIWNSEYVSGILNKIEFEATFLFILDAYNEAVFVLIERMCKVGVVILIAAKMDHRLLVRILRLGVIGVISKSVEVSEMIDLVKYSHRNRKFVSSDFIPMLLFDSIEDVTVMTLSLREREVLQYLCKGYSVKEVAYELHLSTNTLYVFTRRLMKKFKVTRLTDLVIEAFRRGFCGASEFSEMVSLQSDRCSVIGV